MGVKDSNCWTYFLSKAPYDVLITIMGNTKSCPIKALTGVLDTNRCLLSLNDKERVDCKKCLQKWLNEKTQ